MKTCKDCGQPFGLPWTPINNTKEERSSYSLHITKCEPRRERIDRENEALMNESYTWDATRLLDVGFTDEQVDVLLEIIGERTKGE